MATEQTTLKSHDFFQGHPHWSGKEGRLREKKKRKGGWGGGGGLLP